MQNICEILSQIEGMGLFISLAENDHLRVEPKDKITDHARELIKGNKTNLVYYLGDIKLQQLSSPKRASSLPSPIALTWLQDHRQALKAAGWTAAELYRRNKSKGIAWCGLWDKPFLEVYLQPGGVIEFECVMHGRDIHQTAGPLSNH
jgi:hypothetical protein